MPRIVVRRPGMLNAPLLDTQDANCVEVYEDGELVAVMHMVLRTGLWGVTTRIDPDWREALLQLGYIPDGNGIVRGAAT